jgi:hypothetical protein
VSLPTSAPTSFALHMAPGPGYTLSWCVPRGTAPTRVHLPGAPGPGCRPRKTPHRQVKITCSMRTALLAGTPTTSVTVTAPTCAPDGCSSRAGETDRVRISARLTHYPCVVSWQQPSAVVSRHFAVIRVTHCDSARSRAVGQAGPPHYCYGTISHVHHGRHRQCCPTAELRHEDYAKPSLKK